MSVAFLVPNSPQNEKFQIILSGLQYVLNFRWNKFSAAWILDVDDANENPLVAGVPVITGADLLAQLEYLGIGGQLIAQSDGITDAVPSATSFGVTGHLYYRVSDAQAAEHTVST